ncbi:MAG: sulfite exporter TauE/SafE family protein [Rhodospirillales bacterium]|nr:MAG: sulfite exporter TauE/SafE family protein [Rhodospirillales bacterium]
MPDPVTILSGALVGFSLGLIGGGGSILAVPLLLYVVGIGSPHLAIGTSAFAVSANAFSNLVPHALAGHVRWRPAGLFAGVGAAAAVGGASLGKLVDGQRLLVLFALVMLVVAGAMLRPRAAGAAGAVPFDRGMALRVGGAALAVGLASGFFGIGGGFLIVPALLWSARLKMIDAIGSSLLAVGAFGLATTATYAAAGLVVWPTAVLFVIGGVVGGWLGAAAGARLSTSKTALTRVFAAAIGAVAVYMLWRSFSAATG